MKTQNEIEPIFPKCDNTKCKYIKNGECSIGYFSTRMFEDNCPYVYGKWPVGGR